MYLSTSELKDIALILTERLKVDYLNYNDGFFRRRLDYLFDKMNFRRVQDLNTALGSMLVFDEISYRLSVPQTELFRFPSFWRSLRKSLAGRDGLKIWLPSLNSYHELFSLLVILDMAGCKGWSVTCNVVSDHVTRDIMSFSASKRNEQTDMSNFERLESGKEFADYFVKEGSDAPRLKAELFHDVNIRNGWFLNWAGESYDIIIVRDELLVCNKELHVKAMELLTSSLSGPGAMLCIGPNERPYGVEQTLEAQESEPGVYKLKA